VKAGSDVRAIFEGFAAANKRLFMDFAAQGRKAGVFSPDGRRY
jgi:hypothetical protein